VNQPHPPDADAGEASVPEQAANGLRVESDEAGDLVGAEHLVRLGIGQHRSATWRCRKPLSKQHVA